MATRRITQEEEAKNISLIQGIRAPPSPPGKENGPWGSIGGGIALLGASVL